MTAELNSLHVLVTRPSPRGELLCQELTKHKATAIHFPVFEILPLQFSLENISKPDCIIFTSPHAVIHGIEQLKRSELITPTTELIAIGQTTKTFLTSNDFNSFSPEERSGSEDVLELPLLKNVENKKILIVGGEKHREFLEKELKSRSADVAYLAVYQRIRPTVNAEQTNSLINQHKINAIVCTSNEGLENLVALLSSSELFSIPVVVGSARNKKHAEALGFKKVLIAKNASNLSIVETLKGFFMEPKPMPRQGNSIWKNLAIIIITAAFILLLAIFYFAYFNLTAVDERLNNEIQNVKKAIAANEAKDAEINDAIQENKQLLTTLKDSAAENKQTTSAAYAYFTIKMANAFLQYENKPDAALGLLQDANNALASSNDAKAQAVKNAIQSDITQIQHITPLDKNKIYQQLQDVNHLLDKLSLNAKPVPTTNAVSNNEAALPWWKKGWQDTVKTLKSIVVIRYAPNDKAPLIAPDVQPYFYMNLHALLDRATWAMLHNNQDMYKDSLNQLSTWISQYALPESDVTKQCLATLQNLAAIDVSSRTYNLSNSVAAVSQYYNGG